MVNPDAFSAAELWQTLTRLGEAQFLLPALLAATAWLAWRRGARRLAAAWLLSTVLAAALTTASKVAFIGYGLGWAALDFTGFSGHAMFAAAVLPPLMLVLAGGSSPGQQRAAVAAGYALALAVAVSRVMVGAHSWSEVVAGAALGALASGVALGCTGPLPPLRLARWVLPVLLGWTFFGVAAAPPSRTHDWVTRLALAQSGRQQPFQRHDLHPPPPLRRELPL